MGGHSAFLSATPIGNARVAVRWQRCKCSAHPAWSTTRATVQAPVHGTAFGRAVTPPRRHTGHYELRRAGVPEEVIQPDDRSESAFAGAIGLFTAVGFLGPLLTHASVEGPLAAVVGLLLGVWAVDTLALESVLARAASASLQDKRRVATHEAGHLVVAYLLGAAVAGYELPSVDSAVKGRACGVEVECGDAWVAAAVGLGGVAAEVVEFGRCVGAEEDLKEVGRVVKEMGAGEGIVRWALLTGVRIVQQQREAVREVSEVMLRGGSVGECFRAVEGNVDEAALVGG